MEEKFTRIKPREAEKGSTLVEGAMFNGTISRSNTNKATGKSFTATDLIFTTEDGSKVYINAYAGLKQALKDQEINEGDIITIGYNGSESFTNKWGRSAERFLFDVKVVGN